MTAIRALIAIAAAAALCAPVQAQEKQARAYPVARVATPDGYTITALQSARPRAACEEANKRFVETLTGKCATCKVEASECKPRLTGEERAAVRGGSMKNYLVRAGHMRMIVSGPENVARPACEQIAASTKVEKGKAVCVAPRSAAAAKAAAK